MERSQKLIGEFVSQSDPRGQIQGVQAINVQENHQHALSCAPDSIWTC